MITFLKFIPVVLLMVQIWGLFISITSSWNSVRNTEIVYNTHSNFFKSIFNKIKRWSIVFPCVLIKNIPVSQKVGNRSWYYINLVHYYLKTLSSSLKKSFQRWCSNSNTVLNLTVANNLLKLLWIRLKYQKESNVQSSSKHRSIAFSSASRLLERCNSLALFTDSIAQCDVNTIWCKIPGKVWYWPTGITFINGVGLFVLELISLSHEIYMKKQPHDFSSPLWILQLLPKTLHIFHRKHLVAIITEAD